MWPGIGTDFLLLLERDVDTKGFEPEYQSENNSE